VSETFGQRVRYFREKRGITGGQLAATVGRSHSMLSAVENGRRQVHVDELVTFADALGVAPSALLGSNEADHYEQGYEAGYMAAVEGMFARLEDLRPSRGGGE
jgi:transcriptional regulator with XRE-family HTH domain